MPNFSHEVTTEPKLNLVNANLFPVELVLKIYSNQIFSLRSNRRIWIKMWQKFRELIFLENILFDFTVSFQMSKIYNDLAKKTLIIWILLKLKNFCTMRNTIKGI